MMRYIALVALLIVPCGAYSQVRTADPDSLLRMMDSADWQDRHHAVFLFNRMPVSELPSGFASKAITLLEREAIRLDAAAGHSGDGEGYGEYLISLMRGVLRLQNPRSLRGMALLGIQMSREAKEFVASFGGRSLPYLDDAWELNGFRRSSVVDTWAYMIGAYADRLTGDERELVRSRLLTAIEGDPSEVISVARITRSATLIPLLEALTTEDHIRLIRRLADQVMADLIPMRDAKTPARLLDQLGAWREAVCIDPERARRGACQSLGNLLAAAGRHVEAGRTRPARNTLDAFIRRADQAFRRQVLTEAEHDLLIGNAGYIRNRL